MNDEAAKVLSSKGKKLSTHEMHIRRSANKGYIVRHELRDKAGRPPMDGQRDNAEYTLNNHAELAAHVGEHMPDEPEDAQEEMDAAAGE